MSLHHEMQDRTWQEDREAAWRADQERRDRHADYTPASDLPRVSPAIVEFIAEQELATRIDNNAARADGTGRAARPKEQWTP